MSKKDLQEICDFVDKAAELGEETILALKAWIVCFRGGHSTSDSGTLGDRSITQVCWGSWG